LGIFSAKRACLILLCLVIVYSTMSSVVVDKYLVPPHFTLAFNWKKLDLANRKMCIFCRRRWKKRHFWWNLHTNHKLI